MTADLHRRVHLFILDGEGLVGEVELAYLFDHRELRVDAVDRRAHPGAEFFMLGRTWILNQRKDNLLNQLHDILTSNLHQALANHSRALVILTLTQIYRKRRDDKGGNQN